MCICSGADSSSPGGSSWLLASTSSFGSPRSDQPHTRPNQWRELIREDVICRTKRRLRRGISDAQHASTWPAQACRVNHFGFATCPRFFTVHQRLGAVGWPQSEGALSACDRWRGQNDARELFFSSSAPIVPFSCGRISDMRTGRLLRKKENHKVG